MFVSIPLQERQNAFQFLRLSKRRLWTWNCASYCRCGAGLVVFVFSKDRGACICRIKYSKLVFFFFDCLTLKIKALQPFEASRTTRPTHLEHSVTCQETYIFRIMFFNLNYFSNCVQIINFSTISVAPVGPHAFVWRCLEFMDSKCQNFDLETRWMWKSASSLDRLYSRRVNPAWMDLTAIRTDALKKNHRFLKRTASYLQIF